MPDTSELFHSKIMKDVLNKYLENCVCILLKAVNFFTDLFQNE